MMFGGILGRIAYLVCLLLALQERGFVRAEGFTFPTSTEYEFIVGDLVNVSWNVVTSRVSLYEVCSSAVALELNVTNDYSYVWNATRDNYRESGCAFELEPLDYNGDPNPPNLTSVLFGVSKRYSGDPAPVSYNFYGTTSTTTSTATATSSTSSLTVVTGTHTHASTTSTAVAETSAASSIDPAVARKSGLTVAQKVGIGLGVPLGVLAIAVLGGALALLYRRRSRKQRNSEHYPNTDQAASPMMVEEAKVPSDPRMSRAETLIAELPSHSDLGGIDEMEDNRPISELMGTPRNELH